MVVAHKSAIGGLSNGIYVHVTYISYASMHSFDVSQWTLVKVIRFRLLVINVFLLCRRKTIWITKHLLPNGPKQQHYFSAKNPNLGKFWRALDWKILTYFMVIWNILQTFGIFYDHLVHFMFIWYIFSGLGIMYQ
jgi:hypothetical protein